MEIDRIDRLSMRIVMLQKSLTPRIKYFDLFIRRARSDHRPCWVISNLVNHTSMVCDLGKLSACFSVPELDCRVVRAWNDCSWVRAKGAGSDPVLMGLDCGQELLFCNVPELESLVIPAWDEKLAVTREGEISHRTSVAFKHFWLGFNAVCP